jgi:hypothetical protein
MRIVTVVAMIKSRDLTYYVIVDGLWRYSRSLQVV